MTAAIAAKPVAHPYTSARKAWPNIRMLFLMSLSGWLFVTTVLAGFYAYRQRAWADKLHAQLVQTNLDDVKLMRLMTRSEKESISRRFREQGEARIADWISKQ